MINIVNTVNIALEFANQSFRAVLDCTFNLQVLLNICRTINTPYLVILARSEMFSNPPQYALRCWNTYT